MTILDKVNRYYSDKVVAHGASPRGVDWNSLESQELRFAQLLRIESTSANFSLNDLGCGYGQLRQYLEGRGWCGDYLGVDISEEMIARATQLYGHLPRTSFAVSHACNRVADYTVASGIFNVRLDTQSDAWERYVRETIEAMDRVSRLGFAFNCLTSYSDPERMRGDLYYADPCAWFDHCKRGYSRHVALLHDYGLYEFTLLVRKTDAPASAATGAQP